MASAMPRMVRSKVRIELSAQQAWQLRNHFGLEKHIATLHMRALTLREENVRDEGTEDEQRHRVAHCELVGDNHIGGNVMGIRSADLSSDIVTSFFVHRFDEAHGSEFRVELAMKRLNVSISGHQWCLPETETRCTLCTTVEVHVRIPGIGGLVEMQLERRMRASHTDFPKHAIEYLRMHAADTAPSAPLKAAPPPPPSPKREETPGPVVSSSEEPSISWGRLAWALVVSGALGQLFRTRRHAVLRGQRPCAGHSVPVRLGRRHARLLLVCGCASDVLDTDEIVE